METYKRVFVIVLDSLGIGAMPDSEKFGDKGVDTFGHILDKMGTLDIPNLQKLGMLNLHKGGRMEGVEKPMGRYMRIAETSNGKDTMTGHWEMMGINTKKPFITEILPLVPLRQVRVIRGDLEEVLAQTCGDYVTVILTDKVDLDVIDMQDRLRLAFPGLLEIRRETVSSHA